MSDGSRNESGDRQPSWIAANWDKIVIPLVTGIFALMAGYFAAQRAVESEMHDLDIRLSEVESKKNVGVDRIEKQLNAVQQRVAQAHDDALAARSDADEASKNAVAAQRTAEAVLTSANQINRQLDPIRPFIDKLENRRSSLEPLLDSPSVGQLADHEIKIKKLIRGQTDHEKSIEELSKLDADVSDLMAREYAAYTVEDKGGSLPTSTERQPLKVAELTDVRLKGKGKKLFVVFSANAGFYTGSGATLRNTKRRNRILL